MGNTTLHVFNFSVNNDKLSIDTIIHAVGTGIIIKGVKKHNNKTSIIYIIDRDLNHRHYRNNTINIAKHTANNRVINTEFVTWELIKIKDGSMISGSMNMISDKNKYYTYIVEN